MTSISSIHRRRSTGLALFCSISLAAGCSSPMTPAADGSTNVAATAPLPRAAIDPWLQPLFDQGYIHAMVVGLEDSNGSVVYGYGRLGDDGPAPTGTTIFPIGSVSKTFTGLWLGALIADGSLPQNQPVQALLPAGVTMPTFNGTAISVEDLATHTSGLPDADGTHRSADPLNPWADYTVADLYSFLAGDALTYAPGTRFVYSNIGEGLLGLALSARAGGSWNDNIQQVIAKPLGLTDTTAELSAEQQTRRAPGFDGDLTPTESWTFTEATAGAGSLQSPANDMLAYAAAQAGIMATPLQAAMALSQRPIHPTADPGMEIGLNWFILPQQNIVWHNGAVGDGVSFVGFDPVAHKAVVVLTDTGALATLTKLGYGIPTTVGLALLRQLQTSAYAPPALDTFLPPAVALTEPALQALAGTYVFDDGSSDEISVGQGHLNLAAPAVYPRPIGLFPTSPTTFVSRTVTGAASFQLDAAGAATAVTFQFGGQSVTATRK